jgi:hypothetical protein
MSRKYFVDDPMSSRLTLLAGTLPVEHLAAMRLIVTPGTIIDAHAEAERKPKEHGDDDGTAGALVPIGEWPRARSVTRQRQYRTLEFRS